jgi:fucose 4-O-acetylase-like acetyltransferase
MLEGLRKNPCVLGWFKSRLHRIIIPYLLWTVVYVLLNVAFDTLSKKPANFLQLDWHGWLGVLFCGEGATHLWFLPTLLYAQCFLFLGWVLGRARMNERTLAAFCVVIGICVLSVYPSIGEAYYLRKLAFMAGYVFLGGLMVIVLPWLSTQRMRIMGISATFLLCLGVLRLLNMGGDVLFIDAVRPILWVLLARTIWMTNPSSLISSAGICSMGIYLVHIIFVLSLSILLRRLNVLHEGVTQMMIVAVTAFAMSWIVVIVLRKFRVPGM